MRPFFPVGFGINRPDFFASIIEQRLGHSGEYVRHLPSSSAAQWVVMNYQFIPADASITPDFTLNATNPKLWGYLDHFETKPQNWREGDSFKPSKGSQFEIRGLLFDVKSAKVNHVGYLYCELIQNSKCSVPRSEFFGEQASLLCTTADDLNPDCVEC